MFSHVMIGTNDLEKAKSFYDALLGTLGVPPGRVDRHRIFYRTKTGTFSVSLPIDGKPAMPANGGTIGFTAASTAEADAWHAAGIAHGGKTCEDPPGVREVRRARSISPICATPTATSSARCTGCGSKGVLFPSWPAKSAKRVFALVGPGIHGLIPQKTSWYNRFYARA